MGAYRCDCPKGTHATHTAVGNCQRRRERKAREAI